MGQQWNKFVLGCEKKEENQNEWERRPRFDKRSTGARTKDTTTSWAVTASIMYYCTNSAIKKCR